MSLKQTNDHLDQKYVWLLVANGIITGINVLIFVLSAAVR